METIKEIASMLRAEAHSQTSFILLSTCHGVKIIVLHKLSVTDVVRKNETICRRQKKTEPDNSASCTRHPRPMPFKEPSN